MEHPTISIIVPVYRVEAYLRRCLDSLLVQTYPNLQIILVEDGSPDRCGAICDEYAAKDSRIAVIHQKNQGISAARNAALDRAEGQWIGFVDSDDWIEPDMYEKLLQAVLTHDADIAVCGATIHIADREIPYGCTPEAVWDRETTIHQHIRNRDLHNEVWSKLWKRELFDGIRFPVGVLFEDLALVWKLFHRAERVAVIPNALYHYRKTPDSITVDLSLSKCILNYKILRQRNREMLEFYPGERDAMLLSELLFQKQVWAYAWIDRKIRTSQENAELRDGGTLSRKLESDLRKSGLPLLRTSQRASDSMEQPACVSPVRGEQALVPFCTEQTVGILRKSGFARMHSGFPCFHCDTEDATIKMWNMM